MDDSGSPNRQYQGFYYPSVGATGTQPTPTAPGGIPYFSAAGATGLVRRTTSATASTAAAANTAPAPASSTGGGGGSVGYGYFHRPTSSASGHSGFAAASDTGSTQSNPLHGHTRATAGSTSAAAMIYPAYGYSPSSGAGMSSGGGTSSSPANRPSAVQVRVGTETPLSTVEAGGAATAASGDRESSVAEYPMTPTTTTVVAVETHHSSASSGLPRPSPWLAAGASPPHGLRPQQSPPGAGGAGPFRPQPLPTTSVAFLPSTATTTTGGGGGDIGAFGAANSNSNNVRLMSKEPERGHSGPFDPRAADPYSPTQQFSRQPTIPPTGALTFRVSGSGGYGSGPAPMASNNNNSVKGGFFKDVMNRLLLDLDEGDGGSNSNGSTGGGRGQSAPLPLHQTRFGCPEDDLPLLEELGVFPLHIWRKARAVLNPFHQMPLDTVEDTDLAGPVCFAIALAFLLSLQGKIQFSAIYGLCVLGMLFFKVLLTLMRTDGSGTGSVASKGAPLQFIISSLGYALLPSLVLAVLRTLQYWLAGGYSSVLLPLAFVAIGWSSWCATSLVTRGLNMEPQRFLILYPMVLFYALFAAMTIF